MRLPIRDLLWLTALVALGVLWWFDAQRRDQQTADERTMYQVMRDDNSKLDRENELLRKMISEMKSKVAPDRPRGRSL